MHRRQKSAGVQPVWRGKTVGGRRPSLTQGCRSPSLMCAPSRAQNTNGGWKQPHRAFYTFFYPIFDPISAPSRSQIKGEMGGWGEGGEGRRNICILGCKCKRVIWVMVDFPYVIISHRLFSTCSERLIILILVLYWLLLPHTGYFICLSTMGIHKEWTNTHSTDLLLIHSYLTIYPSIYPSLS